MEIDGWQLYDLCLQDGLQKKAPVAGQYGVCFYSLRCYHHLLGRVNTFSDI